MVEREMQELLWQYPERFLNEPLKQFAWEASSTVGRADLVFEDRHQRLLVVEVKHGKLPRGAIDQLLDYFGMMKQRFPDKPVELMVVANVIPEERRLTCENRDIECRAISEKVFRDVAADVGYTFSSEVHLSGTPERQSGIAAKSDTASTKPNETGWSFRSQKSSMDSREFLSRCDDHGKQFFTRFFEAQKATRHTKLTWKHESGFSLQFHFDRVGFAPVVWGFPAVNRDGKRISQRIEFPFDFSIRAGVPESFVNDLGASLSALVPLCGGSKRPSILISELDENQSNRIIETIFGFFARASE